MVVTLALVEKTVVNWYSQSGFEVRLEWGLPAVEHLAYDVDCVVVVDVMSFSTCVSVAIDNGALIYPYPWKDSSAIQYAERIGAHIANFDRTTSGKGYSLSPCSLRTIPEGTKLVLPSPNGSTISFSARDYGVAVFSGCFRNMTATARECARFKRILVIPCGERWPDGNFRPSVEDITAAGGIIANLGQHSLSPEAEAAAAIFRHHSEQGMSSLHLCSSARELAERGFKPDVDLCLDVDVSAKASRLNGGFYTSP